MQGEITILDWNGNHDTVSAIVCGDLALHVAVRKDGRRLNDWSVSHIPAGRQVIIVRGAHAGRAAFRALQGVSFERIDNKLMRQCNTVVRRLRKRGLIVLHPSTTFGYINRPDLFPGAGAVGE